jgi:hypothetical protein
MSDGEWPAPEAAAPRDPERRPAPLPRIEDLPIADQGYDREKVREAFDAFYRHAAQLDATLSTLEAVEVFQRTSAELRAELRTIRGSGWTVQSWQAGGGYGTRQRVSEWSLPPAFPRVAGEALFLIVMGVIVGVAGWSRLTIVLVMALALGVVWLIEWVAVRERMLPETTAPAIVPELDEEPAELPVGEAEGWVVPQEEGPEAMTMLGGPPVRVSDEAAPAGEEERDEEPAPVEAAEDEPVLPDLPEDPLEAVSEEPAEELSVEPDEPEPEEPEEAQAEPEPIAEPEVVADELVTSPDPRRRFRFFGRRRDAEEASVVPVEELARDDEPVAAAEPTDDEVLDGGRLLEEDEADKQLPRLDPWEQPALVPDEPVAPVEPQPEPVVEPEPEPPAADAEPIEEPEEPEPEEQGPLPIEALADQAAAALERSRARRRNLRRARRR